MSDSAKKPKSMISRIFLLQMMLIALPICGGCGASARTPPIPSSSGTDDSVSSQPCCGPFFSGNAAIQRVEQAERLILAGRLGEAEELVGGANGFSPRSLQKRATIVTCTIFIRTRYNASTEDIVKHISMYIGWLEFMLADDKSNSLIIARLAEGYARNPEKRAEAKAMLEDLVTRDAVPDGFAYATLAQLQAQSGEHNRAQEMLKRCRSLTMRKDTCTLTPQSEMGQVFTWR